MNGLEDPLRNDGVPPNPSGSAPARRAAGLRCPQCGGPADVDDESPFTTCGHCRATLWVDLDRLVRHAVLRPRIGAGEARGALVRFLRAAEVDCDAAGPAPRLEFHPWYVVPTDHGPRVVHAATDAVLHTPPKRATEAGGAEAADASVLRDAFVVSPSVELDDAVAAVEGGRAEGARLLHVPSWRIEYDDGGNRYVARVDAVEGEVSALTLPPASTRRLDGVATAWMSGAVVLFAIEAAILPGLWLPLAAFAVTGGAFYAFVRAGERGA
jgi:hypothetical protein